MPISSYPNGFSGGVAIRNLPLLNTYGGNVFWVDSVAGSNGNPGTFAQPFGSIEYTIGKCTANNGDIIMVNPGHTETVSAASSVDFDVAGITVIGLGSGTARPKFNFTAAAATVVVDAANTTIHNCMFVASFADVAAFIALNAAYLHVDQCVFKDSTANLNWVDCIVADGTVDNAEDGLKVTNCRFTGIDAANNSAVTVAADVDGLVFSGNYVNVTHANALAVIVCATGKDLTACEVTHNMVNLVGKISGDMLIDNDTTANTGIVAHNRIGHADTAAEVLLDADGVRQFDNLGTATNTASGYILPAIDS